MIIIVSNDDKEAKIIADKLLAKEKSSKVTGYSQIIELQPYEMKILVKGERVRIIEGILEVE